MLYDHMAKWNNLDQDVVRWGLHQLLDCTCVNDYSRNTVTGYQWDSSQVECVNEGFVEPSNVENDEVLARTLQEELSRLAKAEAAGASCYGDEPGQASILAQDWVSPSGRHNVAGFENVQDAVNDSGRMMNTSDYQGQRYEGDSSWRNGDAETYENYEGEHSMNGEHLMHPMDIADEYALDGEVGKRLNQMVPVPHIPKTNEKIPTVDEEISDHQRLIERLKLYDLVECKIQGDGNCQFRALSDQLYRSSDYHGLVRDQIIQQLMNHPEMYDGYVPMGYVDYIKKMSKNGEWGDHVTLQAAADLYGVKIFVITSFKDTCYIEILPHVSKSSRVICLSFWAEVHYNSIYPEGELLPLSSKKKKHWWNF